jgi:hypothetical protein
MNPPSYTFALNENVENQDRDRDSVAEVDDSHLGVASVAPVPSSMSGTTLQQTSSGTQVESVAGNRAIQEQSRNRGRGRERDGNGYLIDRKD